MQADWMVFPKKRISLFSLMPLEKTAICEKR